MLNNHNLEKVTEGHSNCTIRRSKAFHNYGGVCNRL